METNTVESIIPEPVLAEESVQLLDRTLILSEMDALQRITFDEKSGLSNYQDVTDEKKHRFWHQYQVLLIAMSLERSTGESHETLAPKLSVHKLDDLNPIYEKAAKLSGMRGDDEEGKE